MIAAQLVKILITKKNSTFDKKKTTLTQMLTLNIQPTETQTLLKVGV